MRILVRPSSSPQLPIDVTNSIVAAIARELSRVQGGEEDKAWLEAELLVEALVGRSMVGPCEPRKRSYWEERLTDQRFVDGPRRAELTDENAMHGAPALERARPGEREA